mgnify:CR=1 FL=1
MSPFKTIVEEPEKGGSESPTKGFAEVKKELKEYTSGEPIMGTIGEERHEPEVMVEELLPEDEEKRMAYIELLQNVLIPHKLSRLALPEENKERLFSKLDRLTLAELKAFVPSKVKVGKVEPQSIPINQKAEINHRYRNLSP